MRLTTLVNALSAGFNKSANVASALSVFKDTGAIFTVANGRLSAIPTTGAALNFVLRNYTLSQLNTAINAVTGYSSSLIGPGAINSYTLSEAVYDGHTGMPVVLTYFTSPTYQVLAPIGAMMDDWDADYQEAMRMTNLKYANGVWLNRWGKVYGLPRYAGESDVFYARRINNAVIAAQTNNTALQLIISSALGVTSTVTDSGVAAFIVALTVNDSTPTYDTATINTFIKTYKAFGIQGTLTLQTQGSETYGTTTVPADSLVDTFNRPGGEWGIPEFGSREEAK